MRILLLFAALLALTGCATGRLPSEDIEVPKLHADLIAVLKDPKLPANSREKYEAIKKLIRKVDFTFTRETKTLHELLGSRDAIIDFPQLVDRRITFNYQYGNHYVRMTFFTYQKWIFRVDIVEK